jgi:hypothetical protein
MHRDNKLIIVEDHKKNSNIEGDTIAVIKIDDKKPMITFTEQPKILVGLPQSDPKK